MYFPLNDTGKKKKMHNTYVMDGYYVCLLIERCDAREEQMTAYLLSYVVHVHENYARIYALFCNTRMRKPGKIGWWADEEGGGVGLDSGVWWATMLDKSQ